MVIGKGGAFYTGIGTVVPNSLVRAKNLYGWKGWFCTPRGGIAPSFRKTVPSPTPAPAAATDRRGRRRAAGFRMWFPEYGGRRSRSGRLCCSGEEASTGGQLPERRALCGAEVDVGDGLDQLLGLVGVGDQGVGGGCLGGGVVGVGGGQGVGGGSELLRRCCQAGL